ncbi:uncharacterized protein LOC119331575 [Triticum dicoccoides]|uniref:uncharacterized protein LOC119331575 n=1 Tax=Triticum dicoccoides TaxID=85692 RepID=UPI001890C57C|nr:uncharacterized protein LOC119331575 [Triticum dicoccoides]
MAAKQVSWTPTMSKFMLTWLSDLVSNGNRTSTAFKQSQFNACAIALNEHFQLNLNGDQIKNHNRTWKRKLQKIVKLKELSGALWDEDKCMIVLDHEHYTNHVKAHLEDEQYLNKTITHYKEMVNIAGGSMATGQYAKGSSDPLAIEVVNLEEEIAKKPTTPNEEVAHSTNVGSSGPKPKKAKPNPCAKDKLHATILASSERIAIAIEKSTSSENNAIDGLWESMKVLPGFSLDHLAHYYAYLVDNPRVAMAFKVLEEDQRKVWVSRYVKSTFPKV